MSIKEGYVRKWSPSKNRWNDVYCKLLSSGWFQWFENQSSTSPKRSVNIHTVAKFLAFGDILHNVPGKPPGLIPSEYSLSFAVPDEPHERTKVTFFMCNNPSEMNSWRDAMCSLLYTEYQPQPSDHPPQGPTAIPPVNPGEIEFGKPGPSFTQPPPHMPPPAHNYYPTQPAPPVNQPYYNPNQSGPQSYPRQAPPPQGYQPPVAGQQFTGPNGQPYQIVYVDGKPKKKRMFGLKNAAVGLASGLAGGYLASRMFGGWGWGGGLGHMGGFGGFGRWGSWSSLSSLSWSD